MTLSNRFLAAFNRIEKQLKKLTGKENTPFFGMLKHGSNNAVIRRYTVELKEFADLRNAITHERTDPSFVIAEPHGTTVGRIEAIANLLEAPPLVSPKFLLKVIYLDAADPISKALTFIEKNNVSQFPCYQNRTTFAGLLSERCIARWVSHYVEDEIFDLSEVTISEVLTHNETENNVAFISRNTNLFVVQDMFVKNSLLEATIITENGKMDEKPIGIVSLWDIAALNINL